MENISSTETNKIYTPEGIASIMAGVSAAIVSIIYSFKNIKHSDCGCCSCDQITEDAPVDEAVAPEGVVLKSNVSNV